MKPHLMFLCVMVLVLRLSAAEPVAVTFQLDWKPTAQFAGLLLARERGWYREAGIDLTLRPIPKDEGVVSNVVHHPRWIGSAESGVLLQARSSGMPIRAIGTMLQGTPICLLSLKSANIRSVKDLIGKRIGVHADGDEAVKYVLHHAGIRRQQVEVEVVGHDLTPLLSGRYAAVQGYSFDEGVALKQAGHDIQILYLHDEGYAAYGQVYFTSESFLKSEGPLLRRFLEVSRRGWEAAIREPDTIARMVVATVPGTEARHQRGTVEALVPMLTREGGPGSMGRMRRETWVQAVADFNGLPTTTSRLKVSDIATFDLQP
jgi:ABC-type nitrate/sulfonate/bicarbonate transport system substrate-binding protein